jgi:hypothetical protein
MSLDGYIAGPNGEADWIVMDPRSTLGRCLPALTRYSWAAARLKAAAVLLSREYTAWSVKPKRAGRHFAAASGARPHPVS